MTKHFFSQNWKWQWLAIFSGQHDARLWHPQGPRLELLHRASRRNNSKNYHNSGRTSGTFSFALLRLVCLTLSPTGTIRAIIIDIGGGGAHIQNMFKFWLLESHLEVEWFVFFSHHLKTEHYHSVSERWKTRSDFQKRYEFECLLDHPRSLRHFWLFTDFCSEMFNTFSFDF